MKVAYFSFQPFLDEDPRGQTCASAGMLDSISPLVDVELIYLCSNGDVRRIETSLLERFPYLEALRVHKYTASRSIAHELRCALSLLPLSLADLFDPRIREMVAGVHAEPRIDVVHYDIMLWLFLHPKNGERTKPTMCSGTDAYSLSYLGKSKFRNSFLEKLRDYLGAVAFSRFEDLYLPRADIVHMLSGRDVEYLHDRAVDARFRLANLALEPKWFLDAHSEHPKGFQKRILLSGQHNYAWYHQGVILFLQNVWPRIRQTFREAVLTIHSSDMSREIEQIAAAMPRVRTLGYVDNFRELFQDHDYFVHPLLFGTGQKNRLAIAMAQSLCCMATSEAVEGMNLRRYIDYVPIAVEDGSNIERVLEVIGDQSLSARIARDGRNKVETDYSVGSVGRAIVEMYAEAVSIA